MSQARFRKPGGAEAACGKVIDLSVVRQLRRLQASHSVFYINENQQWLSLLQSLQFINIIDIHEEGTLNQQLLCRTPDLLIIESELSWTNPLVTLRQMAHLLSVPIVWVHSVECHRKNPGLLKSAYAAGASDTLFAPLDRQEVFQTVSVLLRLQVQESR